MYITVTGNAIDGYTADKTIDELLDAYENGKHLACILVESNTRNLYGLHAVNIVARQVTFQRLVAYPNTKSPVQRIGITNLGVTVSNQYMLPGDAESGQVLTYSGGLLKWAPIPDELPTTGTDGQVLTLVSGSPAWADASGGGAGVLYVNTTGQYNEGTSGDVELYNLDKTIAEMDEAYNAGKELVLKINEGDTNEINTVYARLVQRVVADEMVVYMFGGGPNDEWMYSCIVSDAIVSGTNLAMVSHFDLAPELPTGGTAGQVLTMGSDGSPVWADPVATSAEGVEFG